MEWATVANLGRAAICAELSLVAVHAQPVAAMLLIWMAVGYALSRVVGTQAAAMLRVVFSEALNKPKVLQAVVRLDLVDVMHDLAAGQLDPVRLLVDVTVFQNAATVLERQPYITLFGDPPITGGGLGRVGPVVAGNGAVPNA
jgi:hypothetical protein